MFIDTRQHYEEPVIANGFHGWVDVRAPMDIVFQFLTKSSGLNRWWASHCTVEARPGGALTFEWAGDKPMTGAATFRRFEPPNLVEIEWTHSNEEAILCDGQDRRGMRWPAINTFELAEIGGGRTRVHLHDYGLRAGESYEALRLATERGWFEALRRLKLAVEIYEQKRQMRGAAKKKEANHPRNNRVSSEQPSQGSDRDANTQPEM